MFKFLMVFTVSQQKQFIYLTINNAEDLFCELMKKASEYKDVIFFPVMNVEDIQSIEYLITKEWKEALLKEIEPNVVFNIEIKQRCVKVYSIEHIGGDVFNIISDKGTFTTNKFKPCINYNN